MKNTRIITLIIFTLALSAFTPGGYEAAMKATLAQMGQATTQAEFLAVANKFERIARAEQDKWLPYYYVAFAKTIAATLEEKPEARDGLLDDADGSINDLKTLSYDKVEVLALQAFVNMIRISVDPATRGQQYSMQAASLLEAANAINPDNPRVVLMMGQLQYGSAQFFNADTGPACERFKKAIALFESQAAQTDTLSPTWGKEEAERMLAKCAG